MNRQFIKRLLAGLLSLLLAFTFISADTVLAVEATPKEGESNIEIEINNEIVLARASFLNGSAGDIEAVLIAAVYDNTGKLVTFDRQAETAAGNSQVELSVSIALNDDTQGGYAKAFLWNDKTGEPLLEAALADLDNDEELGHVTIEVQNSSGQVLASNAGSNEDFLVYNRTYDYSKDVIVFKAPEGVQHLMIQVDDYLGFPTVSGEEVSGVSNEAAARANLSYTYSESLVYALNGEVQFTVPYPSDYSNADNFSPYDPRAFTGNRHTIKARPATKAEIYSYRNLAVNPYDNIETATNYSSSPIPYNQHYNKYSYPHAIANVVTRDEWRFVPRNAIDGFELNNWHAYFPYQSWGGGQRDDLNFSVLFGRNVEIDKVELLLRAEWEKPGVGYEHDTYWTDAVLEFSDGSELPITLEKTADMQTFTFPAKRVSWVHLKELKQPTTPLGYAALTEFKVYGRDSIEDDDLLSREAFVDLAQKVDDYWINLNGANRGSYEWNNAVYYTGNMETYYLTGDENYYNHSVAWSQNHNWIGYPNYEEMSYEYGKGQFADNHTMYQTFIDLYNIDPDPERIEIAKYVIDRQKASSILDYWYWVDGLYMGMPVYMKLGLLTGDTSYFEKMYAMFNDTKVTEGLYDTDDHLWYRDDKYLPGTSLGTSINGKKVYWSRGNGWAFAALAKVLQDLPDNDPHKMEYEQTFKEMAAALLEIQGDDGFWRRNLDDYDELPQPETSGTAFFTYGLAFGINYGLLDKETYLPAVIKGFNGLNAIAIHPTGRVGRVQPIGENPAPTQDIGYARTQDFGVGAVQLMLAELSKLSGGVDGEDLQPMLDKRMVNAVAVKVGSPYALVGNTYQGDGTGIEPVTAANAALAPVLNNGSVYVPKTFVTEKYGITPTANLITVNNAEYVLLSSVADELDKELSVYGDVIIICHKEELFLPGIEEKLVELLDTVLTDGAYPQRPDYENRFDHILPPAPANLVPVSFILASSVPEPANIPSNVLDRDLGTRWSADSGNNQTGQWIRLYFDKIKIDKIGVALYSGTLRTTTYQIEVTADGENWTVVRPKGESSGLTNGFEYAEFDPVEATSVRITGYGNAQNNWTSFSAVEVLAAEGETITPAELAEPYYSTANWNTIDLGTGNTGKQVIEYDIIPLASSTDGMVGYTSSSGPMSDWGHSPICVRLNTDGQFDARNGGAYSKTNTVSYTAYQIYHVRIEADLDSKKYDVYVTDPMGSTTQIASDFAFRSDAPDISDIGKVCIRGGSGVASGTFAVMNHEIHSGN